MCVYRRNGIVRLLAASLTAEYCELKKVDECMEEGTRKVVYIAIYVYTLCFYVTEDRLLFLSRWLGDWDMVGLL